MPAPRRRRFAASVVVAVVSLVLTACTSTVDGIGSTRSAPASSPSTHSTPSGSPTPSTTTRFFDCSSAFNLGVLKFPAGRLAQLTFDCAIVKVPLNYARPAGTKIDLEVIRIHDVQDPHPEGQLLLNPGGPGASGVFLALGLSPKMPSAVLDHYDLIGFDPRGVGASTPINCTSNSRKDQLNAASPDVLTAAGFNQARALAKSVATACSRKYGSALQYFNTVDTARDMNVIRQAVGDPTMDYLGFSYGTELGSTYAHLFPKTVHRMVLDGAVDPLTGSIASSAAQLKGFEGAFDQFADYCVKTAPCKSLGNPRKAVYAIQAASRRSPLKVSDPSRRLTFSLATTGVLQSLYSRSSWPKLAAALIQAKRGNGTDLLALADQYYERTSTGGYTNLSDANTTINCNDSARGPSDAVIRSTAKTWAKRYPMFGLAQAPSLFTCQQWQPNRTPVPLPRAATPTKVLVLGNVHDPATPYKGAFDLARTMGNAEVLSWDGQGHTSYLEGSSCINNFVNAYLVNGTLPPVHRTCPA